MKFTCDNCGGNEFVINWEECQGYESELLTDIPNRNEDVKWFETDTRDNVWAMCDKCGKEYEFFSSNEEVKAGLIKIGVLTK